MKVFVTGATGLISGAAVRALVAAGHEVTGLTSRAAKAPLVEKLGARAIVGDMRDVGAYAEAARATDVVVHVAGSIPDKMRYSAADVEAFLGGDAQAVEALLSVLGPSCQRFVTRAAPTSTGTRGRIPSTRGARPTTTTS